MGEREVDNVQKKKKRLTVRRTQSTRQNKRKVESANASLFLGGRRPTKKKTKSWLEIQQPPPMTVYFGYMTGCVDTNKIISDNREEEGRWETSPRGERGRERGEVTGAGKGNCANSVLFNYFSSSSRSAQKITQARFEI